MPGLLHPVITVASSHSVEMLVRNPDEFVSHRQLLREVWGPDHQTETTYPCVCVARIRRTLEVDQSRPQHVVTASGVGYRFVPVGGDHP